MTRRGVHHDVSSAVSRMNSLLLLARSVFAHTRAGRVLPTKAELWCVEGLRSHFPCRAHGPAAGTQADAGRRTPLLAHRGAGRRRCTSAPCSSLTNLAQCDEDASIHSLPADALIEILLMLPLSDILRCATGARSILVRGSPMRSQSSLAQRGGAREAVAASLPQKVALGDTGPHGRLPGLRTSQALHGASPHDRDLSQS